ncbi:WD repeat-containing protein 26-like [Eurytemora carolleeae]|uniref:WD repeat-containing protein 26-like n=1 Tax=Eurytemora carolleeae TaxID=1294199 RepID=UPI000C768ED5|nr:WD repeat-containing protein 26-like [Eurytemora carolleeae]XP_023320597.1 WD repeat-containing protein 26-like [Eurytemora carolleeae]|eukprot:XP_023320596.1 WD repeat-containing protein 26-like [Eurytemora affinis]
MSGVPRKRVRSSILDDMLQEEDQSATLEHSARKAMKLQKGRRTGRGGTPRSSTTSPAGMGESGENSAEEGEYVPNSDLDPAFLRKIKTRRDLSKTDQEVVRLIGQHLSDLGLKSASDVLMKESGCRQDDPSSSTFRHCIMKGDWAGAVNVLDDLKHHLESPDTVKEMKFIILEQKYIEYLRDGKTFEALKVLQMDISPLNHNIPRTHHLSSLLMLPINGLIISNRQSESRSHNSPFTNNNSESDHLPKILDREEVMEKLQSFLPPSVMLPPRRLQTLLSQAVAHQKEHCIYHNRLGDNEPPKVLSVDHQCSKETFPSETLQVLSEHGDEVWFCKWSPNGKLLATGSKDCTVIIWKLDTNTLKLKSEKVLDGHSHGVSYFSWSPDSSKLAVCGPEECPDVYIWDIAGGRIENKISHTQEDSLTTVSWSPDGTRLAAGGSRGQFYQFDSHGNINNSWEGVRVQALAYRSDGKHILAADTHHRLRCYNFDDLSDQPIIQEDQAIMSFTLDQTDRYALLNIANQGAHLWDIKDRCLVQKFKGITQGFYTIYSSFGGSNQSFIASGSEDMKVYIYHVDRPDPIQELSGHTRTVSCVSWNPVYHQLIASASDDNTVRIWGPAEKYRNQSFKRQ